MKYTINDRRSFPRTIGVYKISFTNNTGKVYIGSTFNKLGFYERWRKHYKELSQNKSQLPALQNAVNKYSIDNIRFEILEECKKEDCIDREQHYIDKYDSYNNGYNSRPFAANNLNKKVSNETKAKLKNTYKNKRQLRFDEVNNLYQNGLTINNIAKKLKISKNTISTIFKENNIKIENNKRGYKKKEIYQYDLIGNFIKKFNSINECSIIMNINKNSIKQVLQNKCKQSNNFFYSLKLLEKNEVLNILNEYNMKIKKYLNIIQKDEFGNIIKIWKDLYEIKNSDIFIPGCVSYAIKNIKKYKGYYWEI
jgi:group I intron endonuclease